MPVTRKLAAVLIADVVGYSRLMERDEAGTHTRLRELRERLFDPKIAEHGGRIVRTSGDGMLVEFPSATAALRCAVEIQREMGAQSLYQAPDERLELRVGINLGDIIVDGADIAGDGVNVAARLETLAEPGGICVAAAVCDQIHEDLGVEFIDSGEQQVKNISKPIRVYRVALGKEISAKVRPAIVSRTLHKLTRHRAAVGGVAIVLLGAAAMGIWQWPQRQTPQAVTTGPGPPPRSIMVLPFAGPSGDSQLDKLAEALGGDVAQALANSIRDANIIAPNLAALQPGKGIDARALAREANVRYLLAGDVRAAGNDTAVTVQLIDGTTGKQVASERRSVIGGRETEDRELLIKRVAAATRLMFQNAEGRRIAAEPFVATDAQSIVTRANAIFKGGDLASTRAARMLYEQAQERDPTLVAAWVGHVNALDWELWVDFSAGRNEKLIAEMDRDSRRAITIDERDPTAWRARTLALMNQWQWQAALEAHDRALALDPSRFWTFPALYILSGRSAEVLQAIAKRNAAVGVVDSGTLLGACDAHVHLGHYEEALPVCERATVDANFYWVYLDLVAAYAQTGDMVGAATAKAELLKQVPDFTISRFLAKRFSNDPVWNEEIRTRFVPGWRKAGLPE